MKKVIISLPFLFILFFHFTAAKTNDFAQRKDVKQFIQYMVRQYNFNERTLTNIFSQIKPNPTVIQLMKKPYEKKPWYIYRRHFISERRIKGGVKYWLENARTLKQAEKKYGVPANVIVAIIGIESNYGQNEGNFSVLRSLATLAFDYPPRKRFFRNELVEYLIFSREENINPLSLKGSYAGAIGQPQFMPSSYRHYAVDFSGNGRRDLMKNEKDVIGSVANYLNKNGWKAKKQVAIAANVNGNRYNRLPTNKRKPMISINQLKNYGINPAVKVQPEQKVTLIRLKQKNSEQYWLGFYNFYVITRYNPSIHYAMAVHQLSEAIKKRIHRG